MDPNIPASPQPATSLREERFVVADLMLDAEDSYSIAQMLPFDILSGIFSVWYSGELSSPARGYNSVPFTASAVCRSWREAAQATPRLWTRPHFSTLHILRAHPWVDCHKCFARYSSTLGFTVSLTSTVTTVPATDLVWTNFRATILPRATIIDLEIDVPEGYSDILRRLGAPQLTSLRVTSRGHPGGSDFGFLWSAPKLRHLALESAQVDFESESHTTSQLLRGITALDITNEKCSVSSLQAVWYSYPTLVELRLAVDDLRDVDIEPFVWQELQVLRVSVQRIYRPYAIPHRVSLPNLRLLEIADTNAALWPFWRAFVEVACPNLAQLCIARNRAGTDHVAPFFLGLWSLGQIRTLVFRDSSLNTDILWYLGLTRANGREAMFPGLREVKFENAVPAPGLHFGAVKTVLRNHHSFLRTNRMAGRFSFVCTFDCTGRGDAEARALMQVERDIRRWNDEAWDMHLGRLHAV